MSNLQFAVRFVGLLARRSSAILSTNRHFTSSTGDGTVYDEIEIILSSICDETEWYGNHPASIAYLIITSDCRRRVDILCV